MWSDLKAGSCSEELLQWWLMGKHLCCPGGQLPRWAKESFGYFRSPLSVSLPPKIKLHVGCDHRLFIIVASHRLPVLQGRAQNINQTINQSEVFVLCREADVAGKDDISVFLCVSVQQTATTDIRYWFSWSTDPAERAVQARSRCVQNLTAQQCGESVIKVIVTVIVMRWTALF